MFISPASNQRIICLFIYLFIYLFLVVKNLPKDNSERVTQKVTFLLFSLSLILSNDGDFFLELNSNIKGCIVVAQQRQGNVQRSVITPAVVALTIRNNLHGSRPGGGGGTGVNFL